MHFDDKIIYDTFLLEIISNVFIQWEIFNAFLHRTLTTASKTNKKYFCFKAILVNFIHFYSNFNS